MSNYPYIRAHGKCMGSNREWVDREVEKARAANAPPDAVHFSIDRNKWVTIREYANPEYISTLNRTIEQFGIKD